jgi:hypothetical protein
MPRWGAAARLRHHGVAVIAAAGNSSTLAPMFPAGLSADVTGFSPDSVPLASVGALNPDGETVAFYSNDGDWVSTFRTGSSLVSTFPVDVTASAQASARVDFAGRARTTQDPDDYRGGFAAWSGTSFAGPVLAGEVAAALARDADLATVDKAAAVARGRRAMFSQGHRVEGQGRHPPHHPLWPTARPCVAAPRGSRAHGWGWSTAHPDPLAFRTRPAAGQPPPERHRTRGSASSKVPKRRRAAGRAGLAHHDGPAPESWRVLKRDRRSIPLEVPETEAGQAAHAAPPRAMLRADRVWRAVPLAVGTLPGALDHRLYQPLITVLRLEAWMPVGSIGPHPQALSPNCAANWLPTPPGAPMTPEDRSSVADGPLDSLVTLVLGAVRELFSHRSDASSLDRIKFELTLAALHAEVAELQELTHAGVRADSASFTPTESVTFTSSTLSLMVSISPAGEGARPGTVRIDGWVTGGPATVELRAGEKSIAAEADANGRFSVDEVPRGPVRFILRPVDARDGRSLPCRRI